MEIYYFNDTAKTQRVFTNNLTIEQMNIIDVQCGKLLNIDNISDKQVLFVKTWGDYVLLSSADRKNLV